MPLWIFLFLTKFGSHEICAQSITSERRVVTAVKGENVFINIQVEVVPAVTHSEGVMCFTPKNDLKENFMVPLPVDGTTTVIHTVELKKLKSADSGEYYCQYEGTKAYWFLRVSDTYYEESKHVPTHIITVGTLTLVLLLCSLVGSVYVLKGHWDDRVLNAEQGSVGRWRHQNESEEREGQEDMKYVTTSGSASIYTSLQPHSMSIYGVLDKSAIDGESIEGGAKPNSEDNRKHGEQTWQGQDEGVFESVYENV